jgi:hypothetical protein
MWDTVIVGTTDFTEDHLALEVIAKAMPPELMGSIASKPSTMAVWESLVLRNVGVDRVRKAKASTIKREFDSLTFEAGESINDFGTRLSRITNQLAVLGFEYKEEEIVRRFLATLPPKFKQITTSIETLCDLDTITVDELIGQLKPSEERINRNQGKSVASLNLTEDELVARLSSRLKMTGNGGGDQHKESSSGGGKRSRGHGGGRGSSLAVAVVAVAAATPVIVMAETPVEATAALRKMSAATAARKGTGLVNARRRSATRRVTPRKPKKKRSPRCSWQARL